MEEEKDLTQEQAAEETAGTAQSVDTEIKEETAPEEGKECSKRQDRKARRHAMEEENEKLRQQVGETNDKYVRLMAEFDNYRRRTAKERLELIETASKDVLEGFLPVVDDCERALEVLRKTEGAEAAVEGTELIYNKLMSYLKSKGLIRIECKGEEFNTDFHEAVAQFPAPSPEMKNKIIDVVQQGYTLGGKVVRFAKVVVGI